MIEDHLFFIPESSPNCSSNDWRWVHLLVWGQKNLHTRHKYFFEISIPRAKQTWEFPRDVMTKHETQALKQGRVGSNPGNQTSSTKIGGERYIGENPSELLRNFGCSEIWENCSRRHRNFAAFLTSFCFPILKQQWRDGE